MSATIFSDNEKIMVKLEGEIDHHNAVSIRERIDEAIQRQKSPLLCLDFGGVTFMDSSGIGLVMGRYRVMQSIGGRVEIINLKPQAYKVMKLAGIEKIARIKQPVNEMKGTNR